MPIYPVTNKRTGKTYDMPWDSDNPPTAMDAMKFIDEQEKPTGWNKINKIRSTPLTDYLPDELNPSKLSEKYIKPITEEGMAHPEGFMGKARKYGGAFAESLADVGSQSTRPDMLAIMAATGGAGRVANAGWAKTATALGAPGRLLAAKMGLEGGKEAYQGAKEGDWTSVGTGTTKALLGSLGAYYNPANRGVIPKGQRDIAPTPFGPQLDEFARPNRETGLSTQRVRPDFKEAEIIDPTEQIGAGGPPPRRALPPAGPPEPPAPSPSSIAPPGGLPPKRQVFYAGPQGPASTNINEVPTRTFAGGAGAAPPGQAPTRSWSAAQGKLRPSAPMKDVTPGQNWRDILEQNSPYGRILRGEDFLNEQPARVSPPAAPVGTGSVVEPVMGPVTPTAPVVKPAVKPAPIAKTPPSIPDIEEPPTGLGSLAEWLGKKVRDQRGAVKIGGGGLGPADEMSVPGPQQAKVLKFGSTKLDAEKALEAKRSAAMDDMEAMLKEQERDSQKLSDIRDSMRARRDPKMVAYEDAGNPLDSVSDATIKKRWAEQLHPNWSQAQVDKYSNGMMRYLRADLHDAGYTPPTGVKPTLVPTETKGQIGGSKLPDIAEDVSRKPKIGNLGKLKTRETAARKLMKLFGSPSDEQIAERTQKLKEGSYITPDELKDTGIQSGLEEPAKSMPLRQKISNLEMKARGKLGNIMGDETGAITLKSEMPQKGAVSSLKGLFTSKEAPPTAEVKNLKKTNKAKAKDWSTQRAASKLHGQFEAENFADMKSGKLGPINDYIAGDRSGRLKAVDKWVDDLHKQETDANVTNLDRKAFAKKIFEPKFVGKDGVPLPPGMKVPSTYEEGAALGLNPMYKDMAELIGDRTRRSKLAIANKKFDTHLEETGQKRPIRIDESGPKYASVNSEHEVKPTLIGAGAKRLGDYIHNVHSPGNKYLNVAGNIVAKTKNLSLAGGIPKTPLNIHGANIGRSMFQVMGKEGVANFLKGVAKPGWLEQESARLKPLVKEAIDYGYQHVAGEGEVHDALTKWLAKYPIGDKVNNFMSWEEKWFEDPLFKKALPAWKAQVLEARVKDLSSSGKGLTREQILRKASDQSNDFMGGQNTTLRNKTAKSVGHIAVLAPDWAESQAKRAFKGYKAVFGKEDPIYRDALLRSAGMRAAAGAAQAGIGEDRGDKPSDLTTVGLGKTTSGRFREANILGTASEGVRIPEIAARALLSGNLKPIAMLGKDRTSIPAQSFINLLESMDSYGNPMTGEDKYGRPIPYSTTLKNYADEFTKPIQPQQMQAIVGLARGKIGLEEAISQAGEAPMKYAAPQKFGQRSRVRSRRR